MVDNLNILKTEDFFFRVEELVGKGLSYIDAIVHCCELFNIEVETAAEFIKSNSKYKSAIQIEGEVLKYLPQTSRLPI